MRVFDIPRTDRAKMSTMVEFEAKRHIPTRLDHLAWDFQPLGGEEDADAAPRHDRKRGTPVLFAATRWDALNARLQLVQRAGIRVHAVQSECIALHNYLMFERGVERPPAKTISKRPKPPAKPEEPKPASKHPTASPPVASSHCRHRRRRRQSRGQFADGHLDASPWFWRIQHQPSVDQAVSVDGLASRAVETRSHGRRQTWLRFSTPWSRCSKISCENSVLGWRPMAGTSSTGPSARCSVSAAASNCKSAGLPPLEERLLILVLSPRRLLTGSPATIMGDSDP